MTMCPTALRDACGQALVEIGRSNAEVVVLASDVAHPTRASLFASAFPERFLNVGVAEQNMMGIAAGLATCGMIPFAVSFASFATKRAHDQVSVSIAYPKLNVKIVGAYSGLTTPNTGASHQATDDIAIMRSMPNMTVIVPADAIEVRKAFIAACQYKGPVYLRVARCESPAVFANDYEFNLGKAVLLRPGVDVTLVGTGIMTSRCLEAAEQLEGMGIGAEVLHIHTLKPIDEHSIAAAASRTGAIVTVENHSVIGGLGGAVAEVLGRTIPTPLEQVGIRDVFGESGKLEDLLVKFGLTPEEIVKACLKVINRKKRAHAEGSCGASSSAA
jgi:transketolase